MRVPEISMDVDKQTTNRLHESGHHIVPDFSVGDKKVKILNQKFIFFFYSGSTCGMVNLWALSEQIGIHSQISPGNKFDSNDMPHIWSQWLTLTGHQLIDRVPGAGHRSLCTHSADSEHDHSQVANVRFLDASSHLYKRVCPSVHPSVCTYVFMSVTPFHFPLKSNYLWAGNHPGS